MGFLQSQRNLANLFAMPNTFQSRRALVFISVASLVFLITLWNSFAVDSPYHHRHPPPPPPGPAHGHVAPPPPPLPPHSDGHLPSSPPPPEKPAPSQEDEPIASLGNAAVPNFSTTQQSDPLCAHHPDTSNIAVVMKTGATESFARLPTQFMTTLRCIDDFLVFSDMNQTIAGVEVLDSLDEMLESAKEGNPDFDLYRTQMACDVDQAPCTSALDRADAGWKLDKYKNIHMAEKTWKRMPNKDWYLYIDADTYVLWNTLVMWLKTLDPNKKLYLGSVAMLGDFPFAHGGSGYILSRAAMEAFVGENPGVANKYDEDVHNHCCGDFLLSKALKETTGVPVTGVWPTINGEKPYTLPYGDSHWCHPITTMHHMSAEEISSFWEYETLRYDEALKATAPGSKFNPEPVLIKEIFDEFFTSRLVARRNDWDNSADERFYLDPKAKDWPDWQLNRAYDEEKKSETEKKAHLSFDNCKKACEETKKCFQFSYKEGVCGFSFSMRLGKPTPAKKNTKKEDRIHSGWDVPKIKEWADKHKTCQQIHWPKLKDQ
ncbi:hypothetical protein jhhlp_008106 [Lomentospora prolificans]|uniref:N-acetylgalactosaminide beta-1,3-galactosyltransferase n=1 Tax=Lomentospora prolificans TaxID=41688 RepID=A0A2N3MZI7_9PEZI|nr:hypothetical protein jhhlp_008106 [Lomentospora prolificans]